MRKTKILTLIIVILLKFTIGVALEINYKQSKADAGLPGEYLTNFGVSARALAMGKAYTAIANDSSGPYWNPAGLAQMDWKEASFLYARIFAGTSFSFLSYAHPFLERNVLGVSWINMGTGDIEKTDVFGDIKGTFSDKENSYLISYARKLNPKLDAGANVKIVSQEIDIYSTFGYGMDLATMYRPNSWLSFGGTLQNFLRPRLKLKDEADDFPLNFKLGGAVKLFKDKMTYAVDVDFLNLMPKKSLYESGSGTSPMKWHTGVEYLFPTKLATLAIRGGIDYKEIACGFGVITRYFNFDYALGLHELETTHRLGVALRFGMLPTVEEKELEARRCQVLIDQHYQLALKCFNDKDYDTCIKEAKQVLELEPENKKAQELLDIINLYQRKQEAIIHFENALKYLEENNDKQAKQEMKKAEELDPEIKIKQEQEHFTKAKELIATRDYKDAEKELMKTLRINPENAEAREQLRKLKEIMEFIQ